MNPPDKCPKCGAERSTNLAGVRMECGSWFSASCKLFHQSYCCTSAERDALAARVKELEAYAERLKNAGERVAYTDDSDYVASVNEWESAKETKP